ncbi:MAG TPA: hypothetical protein VFC84_03410 [Desulfosporosinus sp.]|nr:hypothetical protein [Desulfosporosinus sp.]
MLRKILELDLGPMTDSEFREVLDLAASDIKANRVDFCKKTNLSEVVEIAKLCFRAHLRGKEVKAQRAGQKKSQQYLMDNNSGAYKVTDRVPWFVEAKELGGIIFMHAMAVGVINALIDDPYHTTNETVREIRATLCDLKKVWSDDSVSAGYRPEKALRANGEPRNKTSLKVYHGLGKTTRSSLKKGKDCGG